MPAGYGADLHLSGDMFHSFCMSLNFQYMMQVLDVL